MDEVYSKANKECLLLAYYFGRIKLLNCVALQRITQDLISAFESLPDNRSTKYTEPIDGCCLCDEKETLFKELLHRYYENTTTKRCGKRQTEDLEKSWREVSEMWSRILVQTEGLGKERPQFNVEQACQKLIHKHGLKVFREDEYKRDRLDANWQALTMGMKNKLEACNNAISTNNGKTEISTNPGPNITKMVMRNVYLTLVTKKAARTHAKFMQNCRNVGVHIRAARDPVSVIAKYTICTLCIRMGNRHKAIELTRLLNTGISYLETNVTLDEFPDTEPTFGEGEKWRRLLKCAKRSASVATQIQPAAVPLVQNNNASTSVRRSVRVPTAKKKNESFLYYNNGAFTSQEDSSTAEPRKKRRASLPVLLTTPASSATNLLSRTPIYTDAEVTSKYPISSDESMNVVIVSEEREPTSAVHFNGTTTTSTSLAPSSGSFRQRANSPSTIPVPRSLVPSSIDLPLQRVTAPTTLSASTAPSCGDEQRKDFSSNPTSPPGVNPAQQRAADILTNIAQPRQTTQRPLEPANTPKVIPISPSSLAQLIRNPQSKKVIFFQSNNFGKGVDLKKRMMIPFKMNTVMTPTVRSRSVSLDSSPAQNALFQTNKPKMKTITTDSTVPKLARTTSQKKPFLVHIVNGKIHKQNGTKMASASSVMKTIPLSRNHVKFVQSVSLKKAIKAFPDPGKLVPVCTRVVSTVSTDSTTPKTLVLGGDMKRGSIMHVGPLTKNPHTSIPQFRLGKSFTFQTKPFPIKRHNNSTRTAAVHITTTKPAGNASNKLFYTNTRPAFENQPKIVSASAAPSAPKKSNPNYFGSPNKTPVKKKRPPSKSMSTVVAEHIFSLMPSADPDLWRKLNAKNIRRSEKSSSLIPVPYETNFLCIHDTLDNFGWKAYWYRKCRCSKIREKAAETDSEYDEPNPVDVAAWVPKKITENMRQTLNLYVESDDRVSSAALVVVMSSSPPKEKLTPTVRVLLEDCDPNCTLERDAKNVQKVNFGGQNTETESIDETDNVDIETVDDNTDVLNSFSSLKRKPCNLSPETAKKLPILTLKAKYRKDKHGNWTAMVNNDPISDNQKCGNDPENASRGAHNLYSHKDVENSEDSVMLNIQPGLSSANGSSTAVAMEDRVGTTNDHGIRRCARATMMRRKSLVKRALDAETRFKTKRDRAESNASGSFQFGSFRDESLTNPSFDVVSAHPMCFRDEPEYCSNVSSLQAKHLEFARALFIKDNTRQAKLNRTGRVEDSVMSLLSSPVCLTLQAKVKKIQPKKSTPIGSNSKTTKGNIVNKLESISGKTKNVSIRSKSATCWNDATLMKPSTSFNKDKVLTENWNLSDWARKVVNQIFPEVAFANLQALRGVPLTATSTNVISEKSAQFVTTALQVLDRDNPVVVLSRPIPKVEPVIKVKKPRPQSLPSESECLPAWMRKIKSPGRKSKLVVDEKLSVDSRDETEKSPPRLDPTSICEPLENIATSKKENLKEISTSGTVIENCTDTIFVCQVYPVTTHTTDAKNCEQGLYEGESENEKEPQTPEKGIFANRLESSNHPDVLSLWSSPKISTLETTISANSQTHCEMTSAKLWSDVAEQQNGEIFSSECLDSSTMSLAKTTKSLDQENSAIFVAESAGLGTISADSQPHGEMTFANLGSDVAEQKNGEFFSAEGLDSGTMSPTKTTKSLDRENSAILVVESTDLASSFSANSQPHGEIFSAKLWSDVAEQQNDEFFSSEGLDFGSISPKNSTDSLNQENCAISIVESTDLPSHQDNDVYASTKIENGDFLPLRDRIIVPNQENAISKRQEAENVTGNVKTAEVFITDTGVKKVCDEHENTQNDHKPALRTVSKTPGEPTDFANENITKSGEKFKPQEPRYNKDIKHGNLIPTFFAIHRDLRTMWRMSKRGSLAHLSMSKTEKDSIPFKKHLRKKLKANRSLSALLSHRYDLKCVLSRVTKVEKETPKRAGVKGPQNVKKSVKYKSKRSARKSPLSNMLNWIWDVSDDRNVELAKYMPVSTTVVKTEPKSRESTPETVRGPFLSKMTDSAAKCKDILSGDLKTHPSPREHEATTSSEVSEVNLIEPSSPSSSSATSPKQQRKRRHEDAHTLDGMYWSNLLDYEGVQPQSGVNLRRRRRIADEVADVDKKILVNKRKRSGHGFVMSDFDHARYIIQADKASLKYNAQKSNAEWEDEEATALDPLHTLLSRSLNVERIRSWIWDSTSPKPMTLLTPERSAKRKRPKLLKRNYSESVTHKAVSSRDASKTPNTEADNGDKRCDSNRDDPAAQKSDLKDCFEHFLDDTERSHVSLMRCSLPQDCPASTSEKLPPPPEKKLFLVRRNEKGTKNSDSSRPIGVTIAAKTGVRRKINFPVLFEKLRKEERKSRNIGRQNKNLSSPNDAETEVVVDDDETPRQSSMGSGVDVTTLLLGPSSGDISASRKVRSCRLKLMKIDEDKEASPHGEHEETEKTEEKRLGTTQSEDGDKTKLQALRETVFAELKRKGNFKGQKTAPDTGTDRRRPLLQSRCSTKGTFISRLLECDTDCLLSNDVAKS